MANLAIQNLAHLSLGGTDGPCGSVDLRLLPAYMDAHFHPKLKRLQGKKPTSRRLGSRFNVAKTELTLQNHWACNCCTLERSGTMVVSCFNLQLKGNDWFSRSSSCFVSLLENFKHVHFIRASAPAATNNEPFLITNAVNLAQEGWRGKEDHECNENKCVLNNLEDLLLSSLPTHPKVRRGRLENGFHYVILPNQVPTNRFEAHMEMHVGSVDEEEHEQGMAHMIEHVAFLGRKKREKLLGTGARSNAYTDFHHTVFHVHSPVRVQGSDEPMLQLVLEALHEIAFRPKFLESRVEKERRAILSELQMMNTIEYRVDCQLLQQLHSENKLGYRFPIGLEEQIKRWDVDTIRAFHERWYFHANATLYIVGDIESVGECIELIEDVFGKIYTGFSPPAFAQPIASTGSASSLQVPKLDSR
eukprot:c583_g1_i1 orf=184-1434(+)